MAYKYNGGYGAVICDRCQVMIDSHITYDDYELIYENSVGDFCWRCKTGTITSKNNIKWMVNYTGV